MKLNLFENAYYSLFVKSGDFKNLSERQEELLEINLKKHTRVFALMVFSLVYSFFALASFPSDPMLILTALLGILFISGTAWFAISFGAIPSKFLNYAIVTTEHLFAAFCVSLTAVFVAASIALPVLAPIFFLASFTLYSASVKYDMSDALKLGLEEALFAHAKVGKVYFSRELKTKYPMRRK